MDQIKFEFIQNETKRTLNNQDNEESEYETYEIILKVNDEIHHNFDVYNFLSYHSNKFSEYYIKNCSCGVPGCSGYDHPIIQIKKEQSITWLITDKNFKFKKEVYHFDLKQFGDEVQKLKDKIIENEKNNNICDRLLTSFNDIIYFSQIDTRNQPHLRVIYEEMKELSEKIYQVSYKGEKTNIYLNVFDMINYIKSIYYWRKWNKNNLTSLASFCKKFYKILKTKNTTDILNYQNKKLNRLLNYELSEYYPEFSANNYNIILLKKCKFMNI